ncbi:phosphoribosylformylglycinamidine synthase subunit PurS [Alphaproteobacteria bacterium]|nr:phosphoribosylformylglycinamidine synthase subunit PurS [Alphaproteobacteria bacterium]
MKVIINISLKNGVLDPEGQAIENVLLNLNFTDVSNVRIGKQIILNVDRPNKEEVIKIADNMCRDLLANTVIENYHIEALDDSLD